MQAKDIMVKKVITASPGETIAAAAKRMAEERIGCLIVMQDDSIAGIATDRDVLRCIQEGHDTSKCKISTHMSSPVITSEPATDLFKVAQLMSEKRIKRLPIAEAGHLVGIISFSDISLVFTDHLSGYGQTG